VLGGRSWNSYLLIARQTFLPRAGGRYIFSHNCKLRGRAHWDLHAFGGLFAQLGGLFVQTCRTHVLSVYAGIQWEHLALL